MGIVHGDDHQLIVDDMHGIDRIRALRDDLLPVGWNGLGRVDW